MSTIVKDAGNATIEGMASKAGTNLRSSNDPDHVKHNVGGAKVRTQSSFSPSVLRTGLSWRFFYAMKARGVTSLFQFWSVEVRR